MMRLTRCHFCQEPMVGDDFHLDCLREAIFNLPPASQAVRPWRDVLDEMKE